MPNEGGDFHDNQLSTAHASNLEMAEGWGLEPQHPFRIYSFQDYGHQAET